MDVIQVQQQHELPDKTKFKHSAESKQNLSYKALANYAKKVEGLSPEEVD